MQQPPDDTDISTLNHLSCQALSDKQPDRALPLLQRVLKTDPDNFPALSNLGTTYKLKGDFQQALHFYHRGAKIDPTNPEIHFNLGQLHLKTGQFKRALKHLLLSIKYGGTYTGLHFNAAVCFEETGNRVKAQQMYESILTTNPDDLLARTNLAKLYQNTWQWDKLYQITPNLDRQIAQQIKDNQPIFEKPYTNLLRSNDKKLNLQVAKNLSNFLKSTVQSVYSHQSPGTRDQGQKPLRIGYLSCDIGEHVMAYHIYPLFQLHDRHHFKINTYSYGPPNQSLYQKSIQNHSDIWRDCYKKTSTDIASQINEDHIDILVDLGGHTDNSRFEIMAHKPAPIQAHYLGFPGSTGADYIDYLFTDKVLTPPSYQQYFSEKLIYLPDCYQINAPEKSNPHRYTRTQMGLPENGIVFCSFNQSRKITPEIMTIWLKLLKNVPNSVLWLVKSNDLATQNIHDFASTHHVDPKRLIFAPFIEFDQQLDRLSLADIALDPILYNGGATTSDALLAGIPVITKTGTRYVSRMSTSMLTCLGLTDCITHTNDEYYRVAHDLATHPKKLKSLKLEIGNWKLTSPLFNPELFVQNLESAYRTMWQRYQQGKSPQSFSVKSAS